MVIKGKERRLPCPQEKKERKLEYRAGGISNFLEKHEGGARMTAGRIRIRKKKKEKV